MFSHLRNAKLSSSPSLASPKNEKALRVFRDPNKEMVSSLLYSNTYEYTKHNNELRRYVNFEENKSFSLPNGEKVWVSDLHLEGVVMPTGGVFSFGCDFQTPGKSNIISLHV